MGTNIYVNGMEPLSEDSGGMCSGAMPDTCFTPPPTPATPTGAPVPYPNTAMASDLQDSSNDTKFKGKPTCLKDRSCLKKGCGDECRRRHLASAMRAMRWWRTQRGSYARGDEYLDGINVAAQGRMEPSHQGHLRELERTVDPDTRR